MPYKVESRGGVYRLIKRTTGAVAKNKNGKAIDGGGSSSKEAVERQRRAIYLSEHGLSNRG